MVKWYPTEDKPKKQPQAHNPARLRGGIKPGQVLILLAGSHQGNRVVFLKQLDGGQLLVTGPYKLNGVPLLRIAQSYTMPTSTFVNISGVSLPAITDAFFNKAKKQKAKGQDSIFAAKKAKTPVSAEKKQTQQQVDGQLLSVIKATPDLKGYLSARFTLSNGQTPHSLKF
jgi:large subunit ribosomal protein L6e